MSRSAEEWAKRCQNKRSGVLCLDCVRAYARECMEAWREKAIYKVEEHGRRVFSVSKEGVREIRMTGGLPQSAMEYNSGVIAATLRALPGETP